MSSKINHVVLSVLLPIMFTNPCESIKCLDCSSVNNSACLDVNLQQMHAVIPIVDCAKSLPEMISKQFFCRKMIQTKTSPMTYARCLVSGLKAMNFLNTTPFGQNPLAMYDNSCFLHPEKAHEVRVHRSCGWIKHKRECYKADNADHLETVCQCFGDMCNAATSHFKVTEFGVVAALLAAFTNWRM